MSGRSREHSVVQHRESMPIMQLNGNSSKDFSTSVQVAVRIRPVTGHDQSSIPARWQRSVVQPISSNAVQVDASGQPPPGATALAPGTSKKQSFTFDRVMSPSDGQEQVYNNSVMPLIGRFLEGYNVTILAYGQTSSGKSYTMGTTVSDVDFESLVAGQRPDLQTGIIPRAVAQIFSEMKNNQATKGGAIQYTAKASFIEIYNEELIDLLADGEGDNRPLVQIREDKAGHIIWSGLKEVRVQNVADVMNRLLQGSSIRRTNETDMNAQSSRSHAIFSLTLTQRKYVGSGLPPSSGTAAPGIRPPSSFGMRSQTPTGRTTPTGLRSGLPRPASSIPGGASKLTSPSRSGTPGSGSAFGLRPASVASVSGRASPMPDDSRSASDTGDWVTVTSKFHFVDLAGSERLKRTAAQGERAKEGISINAGLHALGNVISALGDPAKSRKATHVPYRDSKLTRLLQDSLGGNAHTLMIACVSPTEYNVSETINTLQYANRARNIKNKAEVNEVEVGWEDVEYLQGQVLRLRKEMQLLKGFKAGTAGSDAAFRAMDNKEVLEWQAKYASLSQKFSQLTAEATRLQHQSSREAVSQDEYYKAAEPIIIEYEKTVDALEGQINLQKAALGHCEDIIFASENASREQEEQLSSLEKELEGREHTIIGLQARLTKLEDREATADLYARDLESRLATHTANGDVEATVVADLRKEVARLREAELTTEQYIKELESRLAKSDETTTALQDQMMRLEREVSRREEAYKDLQLRMEMLDNSKENKALLEELDERDTSVLELQSKLDQLQTERDEIARERGRLTEAAAGRQLEKGKLEDRIRELELKVSTDTTVSAGSLSAAVGAALGAGAMSTVHSNQSFKSAESSGAGASGTEEEMSFLQTQVEMLSEELKSREETSAKLQADLETVNVKHKEALAEIEDLSSQLNEVKLNGEVNTPDDREFLTPGESPTLTRRGSYNFTAAGGSLRSRGRPESLLLDNTPARRKSLSRRSSGNFLGYNPKENTPREGMPNNHHSSSSNNNNNNNNNNGQSSSRRGSITAATLANTSPTLFRTRSLSQSLEPDSLLGGRRKLSMSGSADFAKLGFAPESNENGVPISPGQSPAIYERKIASLEAETLRLQEVLKERDEEIAALEEAGRKSKQASEAKDVAVVGGAVKESNVGIADDHASEMDELMRAMARKETESRQQIEELTMEMQKYKKDKEASHVLLENQMKNMIMEIENLQNRESELALALEKSRGQGLQKEQDIITRHESMLEKLQQNHANQMEEATKQHAVARDTMTADHATQLQKAIQKSQMEQQEQHSIAVKALQEEHASALQAAQAEQGKLHSVAIKSLQEEHAGVVSSLRSAHATELDAAAETAHQKHLTTLGETEAEAAERQMIEQRKIGARHAEQIGILQSEHVKALSDIQTTLQDEHAERLAALQQSHVEQLDAIRDQATKNVEESKGLQAETHASHTAALALLSNQHKEQTEAQQQEHARILQKKDEEHVSALTKLEDAHVITLSQLKEERVAAMTKYQQELEDTRLQHSKSMEATDQEKNESKRDLERLQQNHLHTLEQLEALKSAHSEQLRSLNSEHSSRVMELEASLKEAVSTRNAIAATHDELQQKHLKLMEQDPHDIDILKSELAETSDALVTLEGALTETQAERDRLQKEVETLRGGGGKEGSNEIKMLAQSQKEVELLQASLANVRSELQRSKSDIQGMLEEKTRQESNLRELQIKLTIAETRSATTRRNSRDNGSLISPSSSDSAMNGGVEQAGIRSPAFRRESSETEANRSSRSLGVSVGSKPPPLTPPPNVPPPPTPTPNGGNITPTQGQRNSVGIRSSTSSSSIVHNRPDSPSGILTRSSSSTSMNSHSLNGIAASDPKTAKLLSDQAEELRNLAKQLNHCEQDLQANIDLVATLEAALNDSERNLRKSRVQLSEAARERDRYAMQADELRSQVTQAQREADNVRNSVMLEKQGFESKLQMEREAKEKARRALEARLDEVQKKKNGKLFCM